MTVTHAPGQREQWCSTLARTPGDRLIELADRCLEGGEECRVIRPPEVGSVVVQVREPIARQRFFLADMVVTTAQVEFAGVTGWAMRAGEGRHETLAQAICEAELSGGDRAPPESNRCWTRSSGTGPRTAPPGGSSSPPPSSSSKRSCSP